MHNHHNGLKTAALFGVLWAVLLGLGALIGVQHAQLGADLDHGADRRRHHRLRLLEQRQDRHPVHAGLSR